MMEQLTEFTLENGLRAVHLHMPGAAVGYSGIAVHAGTRHEDLADGQSGLAHFVEHCLFKGTSSLRAEDIRCAMESVGGELNAFTGKDDTVIYTVYPAGNEVLALGLVAQITTGSTFPAAELRRERRVVLSEIDSYRDSPADQIYDDFEDMVLAGTPLGHPILGTAGTVRRLGTEQCASWLRRHYTARRCVLFYAGNLDAGRFKAMAEARYGIMAEGEPCSAEPKVTGTVRTSVRRRDTHQTHTLVGAVITAPDARKCLATALLLNVLVGPGMNAVLNVELRERRGLVYTVEASATHYVGATLATVYYGCDPDDDSECLRLTLKTLRRYATEPMDENELQAARRQFIGQTIVAGDNTAERITSIARATLLYGRATSREEMAATVNSLTAAELQAIAAEISSGLSRLTYRPR